jgi:hypothetical protein
LQIQLQKTAQDLLDEVIKLKKELERAQSEGTSKKVFQAAPKAKVKQKFGGDDVPDPELAALAQEGAPRSRASVRQSTYMGEEDDGFEYGSGPDVSDLGFEDLYGGGGGGGGGGKRTSAWGTSNPALSFFSNPMFQQAGRGQQMPRQSETGFELADIGQPVPGSQVVKTVTTTTTVRSIRNPRSLSPGEPLSEETMSELREGASTTTNPLFQSSPGRGSPSSPSAGKGFENPMYSSRSPPR